MSKKKMPPRWQHYYAGGNFGLAPELKAELRRAKEEKAYSRIMNCRSVDKFDNGDHVFTPVAKSIRKKFLDFGAANLYLVLGAKIVVDEQTHRRVVVSGKVYHGDIDNSVFQRIKNEKRLLKSAINGTYKSVYAAL